MTYLFKVGLMTPLAAQTIHC